MDPIKKEIERQKQRWEENVRKQNEEKKRKEIERKKQLEEQRKQKELKRLEDLKRQTDSILLEEKQRMDQLNYQKQGAANNSRDVSKILTTSQNIDESQNTMLHEDAKTDYNMLESLVDPGTLEKQKLKANDLLQRSSNYSSNENSYTQNHNNHLIHMSQTQTELKEFMDLETNVKNSLDVDQRKIDREEQLRKDLENFRQDFDEDDDHQEITVQQKEFARLYEDQNRIQVQVDQSYSQGEYSRQSLQNMPYNMQDSLQRMDEIPKDIRSSVEIFQKTQNQQQKQIPSQLRQSQNNSQQQDNNINPQRISVQSYRPFHQEVQKEVFQYLEKNQASQPKAESQPLIEVQDQRPQNQTVSARQQPLQQQSQRKLGKKEEFLMKMQIEEQMKKMSKAQQEKKRKDEEELMRKRQEILAQVMGKKVPIQNQVIIEESERNDSEYNKSNEISKLSLNKLPIHQQQQQQQQLYSNRSDLIDQSINDRDSDDDEDFEHDNHLQSINQLDRSSKLTLNHMKPSQDSLQTQQNPDYDSEFYKYSEDAASSKNQDSHSNSISENIDQNQLKTASKRSNLQSASSKNRQEYYDRYNMDMSVKSSDYDQLYQHGQTKELQDLNSRLSQTHNQMKEQQKGSCQLEQISYQQDQYQPDVRQSQKELTQKSKIITFGKDNDTANLMEMSDSMVNIETSMNPRVANKYAEDDLPEELREYERQLLAQLEQDQDEDDDYYFEENRGADYQQENDDQLEDSQEIKQVERSRQQMSVVDSKFKVSLAGPSSQSRSKQQLFHNYDSDDDDDDDNDPLKEYYELQKQKKVLEQEEDFDDQFDQDEDKEFQDQTSRLTGIQFDKTQKSIDFKSPAASNVMNLNYKKEDSDQDYTDDFEANDQTEQILSDQENEDNFNQNQKGIALDFGIDEGTIKERKLKKFEELKQRKLLEEQQRKQQQNRGKSSEKVVNQRKAPSKSPMRNKSPISKKDQKSNQQQKLIRRPAAYDQDEEAKEIIKISQAKLDKLDNKGIALAAAVPQHLLKKQQQKQVDVQQQQATPKQTPSQNPSSKKNFAKNSNKKILRNAIQVILAGETNKIVREEVLKVIDETDYPYYIVLFKNNIGRQDYKALYQHDGLGTVEKILGPAVCPDFIEDKMIEKFFRYDSGNKVFKELAGIKGVSLTTDGVVLQKKYNSKVSNNALF